MQHEGATSIPHRRLKALALAVTVATGIGASSATATARPAAHQHATLDAIAVEDVGIRASASASPSGIGCNAYWSRAETLTGIPREVQIGMTAIGYAAAGAPQPDSCVAN